MTRLLVKLRGFRVPFYREHPVATLLTVIITENYCLIFTHLLNLKLATEGYLFLMYFSN